MANPYPVDLHHGNTVVLSGDLYFTDAANQPNLAGVYNVLDYGAVGNGVANDTTACQNALTAAVSAGGGIVYFPPGNYKVAGLSATLSGARIKVTGAGQASKITNAATGAGSTSNCCLYLRAAYDATEWVEVSDLTFVGNGGNGGAGVYLDQVVQGSVRNVRASGFTNGSTYGTGVYLRDTIAVDVSVPRLEANTNGLVIIGVSQAANSNQVRGGWLFNNATYGALITGGTARGNSFYGTILESNGTGLYSSGSNCQGTSMFGGWIENPDTVSHVGIEVNSPGFLAEGMTLVRGLTTVKIDAGASNVVIRSPYALTNTETLSVASGATNITLWDATGTVTVTDNSGGQYKTIRSYLLTGG